MTASNLWLRRIIAVGFDVVAAVLLLTSVIALVLDGRPIAASVRDLCAAYLFWYAAPKVPTLSRPSGERASGAVAATRSVAPSWRRLYVARARPARRREPAPGQ
jgi:hypothetical protein